MAKKIRPIIGLIPENSDEMFIDIELFEIYYKLASHEQQAGVILGMGKGMFLFDVNACEIK